MARGTVRIVGGCPFPTDPAVSDGWKKTNLGEVGKSQTSTLCTFVCSLTSPLPSQRLSLALRRQKSTFTEKIVAVSWWAVAVCTWVHLPAPVYLTPLVRQCGVSAVPLCCCFPGSDSEAKGEENSLLKLAWELAGRTKDSARCFRLLLLMAGLGFPKMHSISLPLPFPFSR